MIIEFSSEWVLTDEANGGSIFDFPVLVNRETREIYKPDDIVRSNPLSGGVPAVRVVDHLLIGMGRELTDEETAFLRKFFVG